MGAHAGGEPHSLRERAGLLSGTMVLVPPKVTPVDTAAVNLDFLGEVHHVHQGDLLFHVLKRNVNVSAKAMFLLFTSGSFKHFHVAVPQIVIS